MNKEELEKLIEGAEYRLKYLKEKSYQEGIDRILPILKDYRDIKYGETKTSNESVNSEEIDTTKELTRGQMIDFLSENIGWKATNGVETFLFVNGELSLKNGTHFRISNGISKDILYSLIPPKPVEVDYFDVEEIYRHDTCSNNPITRFKSCVTERVFSRIPNTDIALCDATKEEKRGMWQILD